MPLASWVAPGYFAGGRLEVRGRLQGRGQLEEQLGRVEQVEEQLGRVARQVRADLPLLLLLLHPSPSSVALRLWKWRSGASCAPLPGVGSPPHGAEKGIVNTVMIFSIHSELLQNTPFPLYSIIYEFI